MSNLPKFITLDPSHHHEDQGTLFVRSKKVIDNAPVVVWRTAIPKEHPCSEVYVRIYRPDGEISHHVLLAEMATLIEYRDFCKANRVQHTEIKNLVYIRSAITQFLKESTNGATAN